MKFEVDQTRTPQHSDGRPRLYRVVELSVSKVDSHWKKVEVFSHIAPGGVGAKGTKYTRAMEWLQTQETTWMPTLTAWPGLAGQFTWGDGRHRFAAWRDMGKTTMPFCVPDDCADHLVAAFA